MTIPLKRPTSIPEMNARFEHFRTPESKAIGLAFQPHPTDVIISPYSKSGTTWLQQIVQSLRHVLGAGLERDVSRHGTQVV